MVIYLDPRVVTPALAPYDRLEIEQAACLLNTILRRRINLSAGPDEAQARCLVVTIETLRSLRAKAVAFGARRVADIVRGSTSLAEARRLVTAYAYPAGEQT